jgi:hypothetical protein
MSDDQLTYLIDIVFCIDVTYSMEPYLEETKKLSLQFHELLSRNMAMVDKGIEELRVRVVTFGDIGDEGRAAIIGSPFFELPAQSSEFKNFVDSLVAEGGGDIPESGLEGLWFAMNSSWRKKAPRRRQIIILATDAPAHDLGKYTFQIEQSEHPTPRTLSELEERWGVTGGTDKAMMDRSASRLIILAPDTHPWNKFETWQNTAFLPSSAGSGVSEYDVDAICNVISRSV